MRQLPEAKPKIEALLKHLREREQNGPAMQWLGLIEDAYQAQPQHPGGMSGWANENDSKNIDTLQVEFDRDDTLAQVWFPGSRNMVWHRSGVTFYAGDTHSERPFGGVHTLASSDDTYIGYVKGFGQIIVYHTVDDTEKV